VGRAKQFFDDVAVEKIQGFPTSSRTSSPLRKADLLTKIRTEKAISDPVAAELKTAVTEFKQTYAKAHASTTRHPADASSRQDTAQITKAMQMVASSQDAQGPAISPRGRPYARL